MALPAIIIIAVQSSPTTFDIITELQSPPHKTTQPAASPTNWTSHSLYYSF